MDTLPGITDLDMLHFVYEMDKSNLSELVTKGEGKTEEAQTLERNMQLHVRLIYQMFQEGVYTLSQLQMKT